MITEAIKFIIDQTKKPFFELADVLFYDPSYKERPEPRIETLQTNTLRSIVDFVKSDLTSKPFATNPKDNPLPVMTKEAAAARVHPRFIVHIQSPSLVTLLSEAVNPNGLRGQIIMSRYAHTPFEFGTYLEQEDFIIAMMTKFAPSEPVDSILKMVSSIIKEDSVRKDDDGHSQNVNVRQGVSMRAEVPIKNPVFLAPLRTFPEVEQQFSPFILRLNEDSDITLFESDNTSWKLVAIQNIRRYFEKEFKDNPAVAVIA